MLCAQKRIHLHLHALNIHVSTHTRILAYIYIYTHTHTHTHTYTHIHVHVHIQTHTKIHIQTCIHTYKHVYHTHPHNKYAFSAPTMRMIPCFLAMRSHKTMNESEELVFSSFAVANNKIKHAVNHRAFRLYPIFSNAC